MDDRRIALVFPGCHRRGGVERVVWEAARHLGSRHHVLVVSSDVDADELDRARCTSLPASGWPMSSRPLRWRRRARRHLAGIDADVRVSFGVECPAGDVVVVQSVHRAWLERGRPLGVGKVAIPAEARYLVPRHRVLLSLERSYFREARERQVVAVSQNVADDLVRLFGLPPERIVVIPNGYDPGQCSPERMAALRGPMRDRLGLAEDDIVALLVANEWHRKGLAALLEAVALVGDERVKVVLVGRLPPDAYRGRIEQLGLRGAVQYEGAADDVGEYYAAADLFVMPTQYEAFGSVIVEALACGVPVITTANAGAAVAVHHGGNGLLQHDPDSATELAGLLSTALDGDCRRAWRAAAPASVEGFSWPSVMTRLEDVVLAAAVS